MNPQGHNRLGSDSERDRLLASARQRLRDAADESNPPEERYSAACDALICCYGAGLLSRTNRKTAFNYGRYRRDVGGQMEDSGHQVVVAWLKRVLE